MKNEQFLNKVFIGATYYEIQDLQMNVMFMGKITDIDVNSHYEIYCDEQCFYVATVNTKAKENEKRVMDFKAFPKNAFVLTGIR